MRIHEFGDFTWTRAQTGPPPGLKSSIPHKESEGFHGSGGLESGHPGLGFKGLNNKILVSENPNGPLIPWPQTL